MTKALTPFVFLSDSKTRSILLTRRGIQLGKVSRSCVTEAHGLHATKVPRASSFVQVLRLTSLFPTQRTSADNSKHVPRLSSWGKDEWPVARAICQSVQQT